MLHGLTERPRKNTYLRPAIVALCFIILPSCGGSKGGQNNANTSVTAVVSSASSSAVSSAIFPTSVSSQALSSIGVSSSGASATSSLATNEQGKALYQSKGCAGCHGDTGEGTTKIYAQNWSQQTLTIKIRDTMPQTAPQACGQDCAEATAAYILSWQANKECNAAEALLPRRLRLLTPHEYQLTINTLFNLSANNNWARFLPRTEPIRGYDNNAPQIHASFAHATQYWDAAQNISNGVNLSRIANCETLSQTQCATKMMDEFAPRVFRRPLDETEKNIYIELFKTAEDNNAGMRLALKSLLISANFLYRSEVGEPDGEGNFQLTSYEIASLLSYTFWGTMPDQTLLGLAANNSLVEPTILVAQAQRLLNDPKAQDQLAYFAKQWLSSDGIGGVFKDPNTFPEFDWNMAQDMETEFELFFADAFLNGTSRFEDLFLADYVFANNRLASFYGISGVTTNTFNKVNAGPNRGGLLNLAGILAVHAKMDQTSPILRGVFVRERLMCQEFPPPPANAGGVIPINPKLSARERFSAHTDNDGCRSCHEKIDPIGFSFERYDGAGKYRETEGANLPVDDSGSVTGLGLMSDTDYHPYSGTQGLSAILGKSESAATCLADQFHSYWQGVAEPNKCIVDDVVTRWKSKNYTLMDLWLESVKSTSFIRRQ